MACTKLIPDLLWGLAGFKASARESVRNSSLGPSLAMETGLTAFSEALPASFGITPSPSQCLFAGKCRSKWGPAWTWTDCHAWLTSCHRPTYCRFLLADFSLACPPQKQEGKQLESQDDSREGVDPSNCHTACWRISANTQCSRAQRTQMKERIRERRADIFLKCLGDLGNGNKQHVTLLKSYAEFLQGLS